MGVFLMGHERIQAEIGCTLNKDFHGNEYATEALTAMADYLFVVKKKHQAWKAKDKRV